MRDRRFGKTERRLSILSLGTMRFADAAAAQSVIAAALANGINHVETAPAYGSSERYIGQALRNLGLTEGADRERLTVPGKLTPALKAAEVWFNGTDYRCNRNKRL